MSKCVALSNCTLKLSAAILFLTVSLLLSAAPMTMNANCAFDAPYVDLAYLAQHIKEFEGKNVITNGTVRYLASIFMYEDFWLQTAREKDAKIPVVTRLAGLPKPRDGEIIEVTGTIEYSRLEGGFYFLNATAWKPLDASTTPSPASPTPTPSNEPPNGAQTKPTPNSEEQSPPVPSEGFFVAVNYEMPILLAATAVLIVLVYFILKHYK